MLHQQWVVRAAPGVRGVTGQGARWGILLGLTPYITPLPRITSHITLSCHYPGHNTGWWCSDQWSDPIIPHGQQHYQWPGLNIAKWPIFQCWVHCCDDVCWCLCIGQSPGSPFRLPGSWKLPPSQHWHVISTSFSTKAARTTLFVIDQ